MKRTISPPSSSPSTLPEQVLSLPQSDKFWEARCSILRKKKKPKKRTNTNINGTAGRPALYTNPEVLWQMCVEYFNWVEDHPYKENRLAGSYLGTAITASVSKLQPMTIASLCLFIGMRHETWTENYKKTSKFNRVCRDVEAVIRDQKFKGAAAGFFNHAIIARDLGLVDRQDVTSAGGRMGQQTIINNNMSAKEAERAYKDMLLEEE